ncbi:hypothetical protein [Sorangium sp. So ce1389]|uniref:hypothetical protein n=1 Tax=Sorangium sp. So ce1389 TaxID=3133336 RepID=UPI003F5FFAFC
MSRTVVAPPAGRSGARLSAPFQRGWPQFPAAQHELGPGLSNAMQETTAPLHRSHAPPGNVQYQLDAVQPFCA